MKIYTDSQAALLALENRNLRQKSVQQAVESLYKLGNKMKYVTVVWIKAHVGHIGNERADELAKRGTTETLSIPNLVPDCELRRHISERYRQEWDIEWAG